MYDMLDTLDLIVDSNSEFLDLPKSRPSENSLLDFCTFLLLKAPRINLLYSKN